LDSVGLRSAGNEVPDVNRVAVTALIRPQQRSVETNRRRSEENRLPLMSGVNRRRHDVVVPLTESGVARVVPRIEHPPLD
jgi:hypothetical protein